jgi:4-hydroxybenzoate polyprenyltransferase
MKKIKHAIFLMRLNKPIGIFLLLWPTWWALWLASSGSPAVSIVLIFTLGVILTRSAGCIINDFADRHIDKHVKRTRERPLTSGKISTRAAFILFALLMLSAFILVLFLNKFTIFLAIIGAALILIYPFMKRVTHLPQVGLGVAYAWGVPMAFAAVNNTIPPISGYIFFAAVIWPVMYDTLYAMVDRADDIKIGVKSTAILFGKHDRLIILFLQIIFLLALILIGYEFHLKWPYFAGISAVTILFGYQQWLIKNRQPENCFNAFLNNNWVGLIIFIGILYG